MDEVDLCAQDRTAVRSVQKSVYWVFYLSVSWGEPSRDFLLVTVYPHRGGNFMGGVLLFNVTIRNWQKCWQAKYLPVQSSIHYPTSHISSPFITQNSTTGAHAECLKRWHYNRANHAACTTNTIITSNSSASIASISSSSSSSASSSIYTYRAEPSQNPTSYPEIWDCFYYTTVRITQEKRWSLFQTSIASCIAISDFLD